MQFAGYFLLLSALLVSIMAAGWAILSGFRKQETPRLVETGQSVVAVLVGVACLIMVWALATKDYSFLYVYEHVDNVLPFFYAITAFWAGQEGSLLFWGACVTLFGYLFARSATYQTLQADTRLFFWIFFLATQSFFLLLLTCWSNPFIKLDPLMPDGRGLNPLLQNPGMIFHPPLLFLGYAGYTIPACLALASTLVGEKRPWIVTGSNWNLLSWVFLTAGIILGGWWSYMELGWGGYWAWDPVENASLIPWLTGTALLHTGIIEKKRGALARTNVVLMSVTLMLCFFGTYIVRSGVIQSLHAFGMGGVGFPLLLFIIISLLLTFLVLALGENGQHRSLSSMASRQGMLVLTSWVLLALGVVVLLGTTWPVLSKLWSDSPLGLDARFYNKACLPLFAVLGVLMVFCPWLGWKQGIRDKVGMYLALAVFAGFAGMLYFMDITLPLAVIGAAAGLAVIISWLFTTVRIKGVMRVRSSIGTLGVHIGMALMILGVAVSGPYKVENEAHLAEGQSMSVGRYKVTFAGYDQVATNAMTRAIADLRIEAGGEELGTLSPEKRLYRNFPQPFSEVAVMPGLGDEIYAVLMGVDRAGDVSIKVSVNPLVNWIWIGGTLACLAVFLIFRKTSEPQ